MRYTMPKDIWLPIRAAMASNPRYHRKPLLRLLELYVLKAIGELSQSEEDDLNVMAPRLQARFGGGGQWHEAVERAVGMEAEAAQDIRDMWARNQEVARANGLTLTPEEFAMMVVDENFPLD
jgi:hypothetical protein